jgi:hypothetical protein
MKKIITIVAVMMFIFAIGVVLADEAVPTITWESKDTGTMMHNEALEHPQRFQGDLFYTPQQIVAPTAKKDFSGSIVSDYLVETGTALYNSEFSKPMMAEKSVTGAAAGGVAREDENARIWDNVLAPKGLGFLELE